MLSGFGLCFFFLSLKNLGWLSTGRCFGEGEMDEWSGLDVDGARVPIPDGSEAFTPSTTKLYFK